jgi:hypothetical protein
MILDIPVTELVENVFEREATQGATGASILRVSTAWMLRLSWLSASFQINKTNFVQFIMQARIPSRAEGIELHQWIGLFGSALAVYHLLVHWDWVRAVTPRFFNRTPGRARLIYLVDLVMLVGFAAIASTGMLISTWLNLPLAHYAAWLTVHIVASIITLLALVLKLGLRARWIALAARNTLAIQAPILPTRPVAGPVRAERRTVSRREFLVVMGVSGAASLLALLQGAAGLKDLSGAGAQAAAQTGLQAGSENVSSASLGSSSQADSASSTCSVRCDRGCSYPGHCRRYVDSNNNNYCDLGECA